VLVEKCRVDRNSSIAKHREGEGIDAAGRKLTTQLGDLAQKTARREGTSSPVVNRSGHRRWSCETKEKLTAFRTDGVSLQLKPSARKVLVIFQGSNRDLLSTGLLAVSAAYRMGPVRTVDQ
jgi:hypothetical protein